MWLSKFWVGEPRVEKLCEANGVTVREGTARFTADHTAEIDPGDGATVGLEFENAIVATGSRPMEIPGFPFDATPILNSRQALALETLTGGGPGRSSAPVWSRYRNVTRADGVRADVRRNR